MRLKVTLKEGVKIKRGEGATSLDGFLYVYGPGPWIGLTKGDIAEAEKCPLESQPVVLQDGRKTS